MRHHRKEDSVNDKDHCSLRNAKKKEWRFPKASTDTVQWSSDQKKRKEKIIDSLIYWRGIHWIPTIESFQFNNNYGHCFSYWRVHWTRQTTFFPKEFSFYCDETNKMRLTSTTVCRVPTWFQLKVRLNNHQDSDMQNFCQKEEEL